MLKGHEHFMYKDVVIRKIKNIPSHFYDHEHFVFQSICPPVHPFFCATYRFCRPCFRNDIWIYVNHAKSFLITKKFLIFNININAFNLSQVLTKRSMTSEACTYHTVKQTKG